MENETARAYREWVENNRELFTDASLFLRINHLMKCKRDRNWNEVSMQFQEANGRYKKGEVKTFLEVAREFSLPYSQIVRNGSNLPAAELEGNGLYHVFNGILAPVLSTPQFEIIEGKRGYVVEPPEIPEQTGPNQGIRIGLHVAYAHSLLQGVSSDNTLSVFDYQFGDEHVEPSMRVKPLLETGNLSLEELRALGKNIQSLDRKVLETIALQRDLGPDRERARAYFKEFPQIPVEERRYHLGIQAHEMKNACRPYTYDLDVVCERLGISYSPSLEFGLDYKSIDELKDGRKGLNDPTLFD